MLPGKSILLFYSLISFIIFSPEYTFGQNDVIVMKAAFMERFTRFIEWPTEKLNEDPNRSFKILILGDNPFGKSLEALFTTTKIKERKVDIQYSQNINDLNNCHMVYVSSSMQNRLSEIINSTRIYSVLSIGDTEGYADKGIMINFFVDEDVLRFEINVEEFDKSNLKVSYHLINISKSKD